MKEYDIYLFDADGTIIDTADLIVQTFKNTCKVFGGEIPTRDDVINTIGMPLRPQIEIFLGKLTDEKYDELQKIHMDFQLAHYTELIKSFPGVLEAIKELKNRGKKLAVVTSRRRASLVKYLEFLGLLEFFEVLVTPEDTVEHKPTAEPALKALSFFDKGSAILVGDAVFDVECGANAKIDTAFVNWSRSSLDACKAIPTYKIDDAKELLNY